MFRLESYLTPWLLGYLDKYVKLKPEDFQLSLWGGDAVFNKLDLRLNVIENLTNIPIAFKSGVIHELRIHIPWTRITSEPVVVTINTLEFVAKLKDVESLNQSTSSLNKSAEVPPSEPGNPIPEENAAQPVPTGYIQNIISKILFNICIIVNNVIVKFVEDDMVLSFNMKSAEFYSVNELWEKTFVDVNTQKIDLKKILQLNDVTICLDKMDNKKSSKISNYQDPLIYRCSIESRLDFRYSIGASSNNFDQQLKLIRLNFYCRKFDVSITDQQLPMVIRFVELIQAIVNGDLNLPKSEQHSELGLQVTENISHGLKIVEQLKKSVESEDSESQQGWMSWAWSYVPSVSSLINEPNEQNSSSQVDSDDIHIIIGCYFDQFNLSFKLAQHNSTNLNKNSSNFANFVSCYLKGIAVEVNTKTNFNHVLFGISYICVQSMGECCCKLCPKPAQNELIFIRAGHEDIEEKTFHYLSNSLFDISVDSGIGSESTDPNKNEKSRDKNGNVDENYGERRFGAVFMDYLCVEDTASKEPSEDVDIELSTNQADIFSLYFIFYSVEINVSANLVHRLCKIYECCSNHEYTEPYSRFQKLKSESNSSFVESVESGDQIGTHSPIKKARQFEKHTPIRMTNFIFKQPLIKFYPYSHFLIAPIASQDVNFECFFKIDLNYLYFNITRPVDEKSLFDVVSKLPNPSKKLVYDSYTHNQFTVDGLKLSLGILNSNYQHECAIIEPCYLEFNFSNVIMSPEMWNKQYFVMSEFYLELPVLNLNLNKEMIFLISDYMDNYLFSILNNTMMEHIKRPFINKLQMKKAKYRQIMYKQLLRDFIRCTKYQNSETLRFSINDLKTKYSLTKIMQIIQINCNMCNLYMFKNDHRDLAPLLETLNEPGDKKSKIKDFLTLKAQLPLKIDTENSYVPDPIFVYINLNTSHIQIRDDFLKWLSYKPCSKGDSELFNLLVLDLFEDVANIDKIDDNYNLLSSQRSRHSKTPSENLDNSSSKKSLVYYHAKNLSQDDSVDSNLPKPTLIDYYYDLIQSLHVQISIGPIDIDLSHDNSKLWITLPHVYIKSSGTKCDLEEELINSKLVELPCTYLRACEKTSNKLPWIMEMKHFGIKIDQHGSIVDQVDFNSVFMVKPKYHQYDNLLSSLAIILDLEINQKIQLNITLDNLKFILNLVNLLSQSLADFEHRINYEEIKISSPEASRTRQTSEDDTKSYSSVSILKEYDWIDTDECDIDFEPVSTGDVSSSESNASNFSKYRPRNLNLVKNFSLVHKSDQSAKINFSLNFLINSFSVNLSQNGSESLHLGLNRLIFESDINQIYQRYEIKLKKANVSSSSGKIFVSDSDNFLSLAYTSAMVKNLTKRIGIQMNQSLKKNFQKHHKYIGELNLSIGSFELDYNRKLFDLIFKLAELVSEEDKPREETNTNLIPVIGPCKVPLVNLEIKNAKIQIPGENNLTIELKSMSITSQFENPLVRNFVQNSTSQQIYLKAKSHGLINRPGYMLEDRQYLLNLNDIKLEINNFKVIEEFRIKFIVALPILYGSRLIHGYSLELSMPQLNVNLDPCHLNTMWDVLTKEFQTAEPKQTQNDQNLSLVPCDLLVTFEKIYFNLSNGRVPVLNLVLTQPHVCFFMHENSQKFEVSIYDMGAKEGVMETKPGEPDAKTGILLGLFMFRVKNFAHLFQALQNEIVEVVNKKNVVCDSCFRSNELTCPTEKLKTEIYFERPIRLRLNLKLIDDFVEFLNNFGSGETKNEKIDDKFDYFKFLNINALTSQIVLSVELNEMFTLTTSLNGFNLKSSIESKNLSSFFKLNDLNINLNSNDTLTKIHFFGPMSFNGSFGYDLMRNQMAFYCDLGSFTLSLNHYVALFIDQFQQFLKKYNPKSLTTEDEKFEQANTIHDNEMSQKNLITKHSDDLRSGSFSYKIIDDNYIKKMYSTNYVESCYPHLLLPSSNEIICIDDLSTTDTISSICWKYQTKRSITSLKIFPLPFIGSQEMKASGKFKFYVDYLNESSKKFDLIKEFDIQEGTQSTVIDIDLDKFLLTDLIWAKTWRIRLSNEAKKFIFASSLLASTQVNSIELTEEHSKIDIDVKISNIELKVNSFSKKFGIFDLALVNLTDLNSKLSLLEAEQSKICSVNLVSQISADYSEYQFGTFRPIIDPFRLKVCTRYAGSTIVESYIDTVNFYVSQSSLNALKAVQNEFVDNQDEFFHYFSIHNDTNLDLCIKQFDTEETCLVTSGGMLPYFWRTHKKLPLMQLYVPRYKKHSQKFTLNNQVDKSVIQEVKIQINKNECLSFFINLNSQMCHQKHKRVVLIQSKFFVCNYLNVAIKQLRLVYGNEGKELSLDEISEYSRSKTSLCLIESNTALQIQSLKIAHKNIKSSLTELRNGILWHDDALGIKYWLNIYQNEQLSQISLILSPLYIICSYLPYNLTINFNQEKKILRSNSCSVPECQIDQLNMEIIDSLKPSDASQAHFFSSNSKWFEEKNELIGLKKLDPNLCNFQDKKLVIHDPFKYSFININRENNERVSVKVVNETNEPVSLEETRSNVVQKLQILKSNFVINREKFWPLSNTQRVNIRPECLLLNNTEFDVRITEHQSGLVYDIGKLNGQVCLSHPGSSKRIKFTVCLEEYSLQDVNNIDLDKVMVEYESEWIELKDEPVSPFYRERVASNVLYMNKCWIDLKLRPIGASNPRYDSIYFVLNSEDRNFLNKNLNEITMENLSADEFTFLTEQTYRILKLEPKFVLKNKLGIDVNFLISNSFKQLSANLMRSHVAMEKNCAKPKQDLKVSYIVDRKNMFIKEPDGQDGRLGEVNFLLFENVEQSKCVILTCNEKPLKQMCNQNENLLISRQCVTIKNDDQYTGVIITQKLLVAQNGQLVVAVKQDPEPLVTLRNSLQTSVYVWPRLSTNFIVENYLKNCCQKSMFTNYLVYLHKIPSGGLLHYNYDFIGTDHFPIENLNEQIVFMFSDDNLHLSQILCKMYADNLKVTLKDGHFFYLKKDSKIRILSHEDHLMENFIDEKRQKFLFNLNVDRFTLALNDDYMSNFNQVEILRLSIDKLKVELDHNLDIKLDLFHLQLDNQMYDNEKYDFPVIFIPRQVNSLKPSSIDFGSVYAVPKSSSHPFEPFLNVNLGLNLSSYSVEKVEVNLKNFDVYLEDSLITYLIRIVFDYVELVGEPKEHGEIDLDLISSPILRVKKLQISSIDCLVTLQTTSKVYLATHKTPVIFDQFQLIGHPESLQSLPQLINKLTSHYLTSLIFRAGWLIGSLDLIGSPTAFVQQVSNGVLDFLLLPYRELRRDGPRGLFQGFSQGSLSLIRNLSAGTITSMTSFASFISRNMDILSFDPQHLARQDSLRHHHSDSIGSGFVQVSSSFLVSIMGAIGGLAEQPIQSVHNSDSILKGLSKGIIGLVTKPVGAVAELVNQTGQGLLKITGISRGPLGQLRLYKRPLNMQFSKFSISSTKFTNKLLNSSKTLDRVNSIIECVYINKCQVSLSPCYLALGDQILYMMDKHEDMLLRAFYISEIDVRLSRESDNEIGLCVVLNSRKIEDFVKENDKLYENNLSRLMDFVMQSERRKSENAVTCSCGHRLKPMRSECEASVGHSRQESDVAKIHKIQSSPSMQSESDDRQKKFYFYVDPRVSENFINIFNSLKRKVSNKGFAY